MILGTINRDGDIWCCRVFRPVSMLGDKDSTELLPVCFHERSDLVCGEVFRRIKKVERIPAHCQHHLQFFHGTQITHHSYSIWLPKENHNGTRYWQDAPATKLVIGQFICFIDHDAQRIALPEIARIPTIAKEARLDTFAFPRQVIEFWMICVRLTKRITDLQHRKALFLECAVETSIDLCHFNALTYPRFITSLFAPNWHMLFTPGHKTQLNFCCILERGINEHFHVLLACH